MGEGTCQACITGDQFIRIIAQGFDGCLLPAAAHAVDDLKYPAGVVLVVLLGEVMGGAVEEGFVVTLDSLPGSPAGGAVGCLCGHSEDCVRMDSRRTPCVGISGPGRLVELVFVGAQLSRVGGEEVEALAGWRWA